MPALQVRDFPPDLYEALKECAARNHRSMAQQTVAFVEEGLLARNEDAVVPPVNVVSYASLCRDDPSEKEMRIARRREALERLRDLREKTGFQPLTPEQLVEMKRAEHEARTDRILATISEFAPNGIGV